MIYTKEPDVEELRRWLEVARRYRRTPLRDRGDVRVPFSTDVFLRRCRELEIKLQDLETTIFELSRLWCELRSDELRQLAGTCSSTDVADAWERLQYVREEGGSASLLDGIVCSPEAIGSTTAEFNRLRLICEARAQREAIKAASSSDKIWKLIEFLDEHRLAPEVIGESLEALERLLQEQERRSADTS